jgi:hypothetical protein
MGFVKSTPRELVDRGDGTCAVRLSRGLVAVIDSADAEMVGAHSWFAHRASGLEYALRRERGKFIRLHRALMNAPKGLFVDHINGDTLDNRRANLRLCTALGNAQNARLQHNNSSGYKGVSWNKRYRYWVASIYPNDGHLYLGSFRSAEEAARAYNTAALKYYGEFARLNVLPEAP